MLDGVGNLLGVLVEKPSQILRHIIAVEARLGGVCEDGQHPRVCGDHHELPAEVEHVERVHLRRQKAACTLLRRNPFHVSQLGNVGTHRPPRPPIVEIGGRLARHCGVDRRGRQRITDC